VTSMGATSFLLLAHAAHWYFMPLYAAPVLLVLYGAMKTSRDERRKSRDQARRQTKRTKR
jgi:threonine/homoserine/homoserine lactone efflux protein